MTYSKIPWKVKEDIGAVAIGAYAIFCKGILLAAKIGDRIYKKDCKDGIPAYGYLIYNGKKYYYCRYGFVSDPDTYTKKPKTANK